MDIIVISLSVKSLRVKSRPGIIKGGTLCPSCIGVTSSLHSQRLWGRILVVHTNSLKTVAVCDASVTSLIVSYLEPRDADIIFAPNNWRSIPFGQ